MLVNLLDGHHAVLDRDEFDVGRILEGVADEFVVTDMSEPAAKSVVPPQVGVDGMVHRRDVALARDVTAGDDLAGEVQTRRGTVTVVTKMLALHVADRNRTDRRLPGLVLRFRRRMP